MFYNGIFISETSPRECERGAEARREPFGHEKLWRGGGQLSRGEVLPEAQVCKGSKHLALKRGTPVFTEQHLHFQHCKRDYA